MKPAPPEGPQGEQNNPSLSAEKAREIVLAQLTPVERAHGTAFLAATFVPRGARLQFPRLVIEVPWRAWLAFIDGEPNADWGHPCRYLLIGVENGETRSFPGQFPPFRVGSPWCWQVVHKAPTAPDAAVSP